ncbi:hypothetical protein EV356DRAFT_530455 [Viridothelium virens]|uniref:DUF6594 domain-containing protein n=1 Tax=Viridothelium virens TaxID=1048519 RepID=A0A6A6HGC2_VIRVR|nr:hypothetical protein EV356DRAFT_530455 [Viridothelium virens]
MADPNDSHRSVTDRMLEAGVQYDIIEPQEKASTLIEDGHYHETSDIKRSQDTDERRVPTDLTGSQGVAGSRYVPSISSSQRQRSRSNSKRSDSIHTSKSKYSTRRAQSFGRRLSRESRHQRRSPSLDRPNSHDSGSGSPSHRRPRSQDNVEQLHNDGKPEAYADDASAENVHDDLFRLSPEDIIPEDPNEWLVRHHLKGLLRVYDVSRHPDAKESKGHIAVSFAEMQRMRLRKLQIKLVYQAVEMYCTSKESEGWEQTLQQYIQATRDNDYVHDCARRLKDPFVVTSKRFVDADLIRSALRSIPEDRRDANLSKIGSLYPPLETSAEPIGGTRHAALRDKRVKTFLFQLGMAAIGGGFLLAPMWLMVLHSTQYTALITTSVCVILFGISMAWVLDQTMNVLSVTAAYAAVLVVFVGATNPTTGPRPNGG